ncbi:phospholipase D-like domain-containing protein [Flavobacteriales bacterium]|nr:phospholipase D-like domain-containing protein [Flavobacteriales bacterium]
MKKITTLIIATLFSVVGFTQTNIATARSQGIGASVIVTGIVTNGSELGDPNLRYIEDNTGGMALYSSSVSGFQRGDEVTVSGVLKDYYGLLEMDPVNSNTTNTTGNAFTPQVLTPIQINEATESELVQINNVIFNNGGSFFTGNTAFDFMANGLPGKVYIKNGNPLIGTLIPMGTVTLIGIASQHTYNFGCPHTSGVCPASDGYQVLPRDSADIIQSGGIIFTSAVNQTNITTSSFDLSWSISSNSTTNCNYGTTTSLGSVINNGGSTQNHTISLTGLSPATFYYVQCYSIDGLDTAFSSIGMYSTASNSSGSIRPFFNHSVDISFSSGVDAQDVGIAFADTIASYMDLAQTSLDICVYNASSTIIAAAINAAYNRGVAVRYIADDDVANIMLSSLDPNIPIITRDPSLAGIMHNKFIIIDANTTNNSWILGGSTNWTNPSNLINDYNNMIFIQDEAIAKAYTLEFEEMWGGVFGTNKLDNTPHKFMTDGKLVEIYFSPSDQTTSHILATIKDVDNTLEFGLLSFTRDDLGQAVIDKDIEFGVTARGIIEQENVSGSEFATLSAANVNVRSHMGVTHDFHHKYLIVDANDISADPTVLTGSHNWSSNAENNSDENTLIIHDAIIANIYLQEFEERWGELESSNTLDELINIEVSVFPNPSAGKVEIKSDLVIEQINLYAVDGKLLNTTQESIIQFDTSGIYFIKIITKKGIVVKKIVIE